MSITDWSKPLGGFTVCPGCLGQAVVALRWLCAIVESPRRHKRAPFVNIASLRSRSIKRRQWKHKLEYYDIIFAHLATGCGIHAKDFRYIIGAGQPLQYGEVRGSYLAWGKPVNAKAQEHLIEYSQYQLTFQCWRSTVKVTASERVTISAIFFLLILHFHF